MTTVKEAADEAVRKHFRAKLPPELDRLRRLANWDLYYGPVTEPDDGEPWPGFVEATDQLSEWADDTLEEVWIDTQSGEVLASEPEGEFIGCQDCGGEGVWEDNDNLENECTVCSGTGQEYIEPCWLDYYHYEISDVKRAVFGKELAAHI